MKKNMAATSTRLQIKKFEPTILSDKIASDSSPVICIIGKRNTGKSEVIRTLLYHNKQIPTGIIISPTEMGNKFYGSFCPDSFIHHRFDPDVLGRIIDRQRKRVSKYGKIPKNNLFVILDDCMYESKEMWKHVYQRNIQKRKTLLDHYYCNRTIRHGFTCCTPFEHRLYFLYESKQCR